MQTPLLATAGLVEDGAGEMMRVHLLSLPVLPSSLIREFSFYFSIWAFLQIPLILAAVYIASRLIGPDTTAPTRVAALVFVYMAATLATNIGLGFVTM